MKLAVGIISTNEEPMLLRHLPMISKTFEGEVVGIDFGSTDKTREIMDKYCKKVETLEWPRHFGNAKTLLITLAEKCGYDWLLVMDSDESLELNKVKMMKDCIENNFHTLYYLPRLGFNAENSIEGSLKTFPDLQARLFKLNEGYHYRHATHCQLCQGDDFKNVYELNKGAVLPIFIYHYAGMKSKEVLLLREMERYAIEVGLPLVKSLGDIKVPEGRFKLEKQVIINLK